MISGYRSGDIFYAEGNLYILGDDGTSFPPLIGFGIQDFHSGLGVLVRTNYNLHMAFVDSRILTKTYTYVGNLQDLADILKPHIEKSK